MRRHTCKWRRREEKERNGCWCFYKKGREKKKKKRCVCYEMRDSGLFIGVFYRRIIKY
jgi:hypothetical protein